MTVPKITSEFALLDIMQGRSPMAKLCITGHRIPVTISGWISAGKGGIGSDDGVSREFAMEVSAVELGEPEYVPLDKLGRPWALASHLSPGDFLECDGGFSCLEAGSHLEVKRDRGQTGVASLYVMCADGKHFVCGALGEKKNSDALIGFYRVKK